jgi:hypothetical protein
MDRIECRLLELLAKISQTGQSFALTNKSFAIQLLFQTFLFAVRVRTATETACRRDAKR